MMRLASPQANAHGEPSDFRRNGDGCVVKSDPPGGDVIIASVRFARCVLGWSRAKQAKEECMALDFYDAAGSPYAYSEDGSTVYTYSGVPVAYVRDDSVYAFSGRHLGFLEDGQIWDHSGAVILFTAGATGGPMKPLRAIKPVKDVKRLQPLKGIPELKPISPIRTMGWSALAPEQVFET